MEKSKKTSNSKINIFKLPFACFYSGNAYRAALRDYNVWGVTYWWSVMLLAVLLFCSSWAGFLLIHAKPETVKMIQSIPNVTIYQGNISLNKMRPYQVYYPNSRNVMINFVKQYAPGTPGDYIVTENGVHIKHGEEGYEYVDLSQLEEVSISNSLIFSLFSNALSLIFVVVAPILWIVLGLSSSIFIAIVALIMMALTAFLSRAISYKQAYWLSCVALTPCLFITTLYMSLPFYIPYVAAALLLVALIYLQIAASNATE